MRLKYQDISFTELIALGKLSKIEFLVKSPSETGLKYYITLACINGKKCYKLAIHSNEEEATKYGDRLIEFSKAIS